jgi:5-methylcytosine-specific restriction enzyme subunit McrC
LIQVWEQYGYSKYCDFKELADFAAEETERYSAEFTKEKDKQECFALWHESGAWKLRTSYIIGLAWVKEDLPIYIAPKFNKEDREVNYLAMLMEALEEPENAKHMSHLFTIDFDAKPIPITHRQDKLTPLLIVQFLGLMKSLVRKGLKKGYYSIEQNLNARVRGKVLINKTIKTNHTRSKLLHTVCSYDEFGVNIPENQLLKRALLFVQKMVYNLKGLENVDVLKAMLRYTLPAFEQVNENASSKNKIRKKGNNLYAEYEPAMELAQIILKKYGYAISNVQEDETTSPPYWIDMSKLFELYTFKKLREHWQGNNQVKYHQKFNYLESDFIVNTGEEQYVVDAKYKDYADSRIATEDARQVAGYARMNKVFEEFGLTGNERILDCLIVYPDMEAKLELRPKDKWKKDSVYFRLYKTGIGLPESI